MGVQGGWIYQGQIASGLAPGNNIIYADINGDGKADYLILDPNTGSLTAYINNGTDKAGNSGWTNWGQIATGQGTGADIRIADFNGDGKADYMIVDPVTGSLHLFLNNGTDHAGKGGWIDEGKVAAGEAPGANVRMVDINGDGYADYLVVDPNTGAIDAWLNVGGDSPGSHGWQSMGRIAYGVGALGANVQLADINNDGWADYLVVDPATGAVKAYLNQGGDSSSWTWKNLDQIAHGLGTGVVRIAFADLNGDGRADYLLIANSNGHTDASLNNGGDPTITGTGGWISAGRIAYGIGATSSTATIQFADIDGDGKADYLAVDNVTGAITAARNQGQNSSAPGDWSWGPNTLIAYGIGAPGTSVRLADIDGDGKADYIALNSAGGMTVAFNQGGMLGAAPQGTSSGWGPNKTIAAGVLGSDPYPNTLSSRQSLATYQRPINK